ncbi:MAG: universal stress protein [Desulfobacterales bacterium]|jgi:nucleotide-binding universal stress UspA family protein|nr:universal stress protein [Desulfobacterales bacterium]
MFKHILLPTDGSDLSQVAIRKGVRFAKSIGAKVTGVCVVPTQKYFLYMTEITEQLKEESARHHKQEAERNLAFVAKAAADAGVPCETLCETGDQPHASIVAAAEAHGCDLILMASHGRKGVASLLLGSETQKVLTHSRLPVLVVR